MPEASYDEASRARYRARARRAGGGGAGGYDRGLDHVWFILAAVLCVVGLRLFWLQVVQAKDLSAAAESSHTIYPTLHAKRGTIYDRNGNVLAMSVDCSTIYCNPKDVHDPSGLARVLADVLGGTPSDYLGSLTADTTFVYIGRQIDQDVADKLRETLEERGLTGIYYLDDTKRVYPYGDVGGQLIGLVNVDGEGTSGLELYYDDVLSGVDGQMIMEIGKGGIPIAGGVSQVTEAQDGLDIVLSIDIDLQAKCEQEAADAQERYGSDSASIMVTNPRTGEIYAACSTPLATITDRSTLDPASLNLRLVSDCYEPGSVFKVLTTAIAFDYGLIEPDQVFNVPPRLLVGDDWVTEDTGRDYYVSWSTREILYNSSNPGAAMIGQDIVGAERFARGMERFGIGQATGIDYPGEVNGLVKTYSEYDGATCGAMSFGQAVAIPMVQLVRAFGAVANDGVLTTPHFAIMIGGEEVSWPQGGRAISVEASDKETDIMRSVMELGTGTRGQVYGYDIAGKTGTGEQASGGGYADFNYVASLCGFANADDPDVLVYVGLNGTAYLAYASSAEVFHNVMSEAVTDLSVPAVY